MANLSPKIFSSIRANIPDIQVFLKDISVKDVTGAYLRYDPLYDEIRLGRQEDDPRLSMGIWETEVKRADWPKIEQLCVEALCKKTKDIQLAAWLLEAWVALDGIIGYNRGITLLIRLCETFWPILHPQPQENEDMESRLMIFEWLDSTVSSRLMMVPLTQSEFSQTGYGFGNLKSAHHADMLQKRADSSAKKPTKNDVSKVMMTSEEFHKNLDQTPTPVMRDQQQSLGEALEKTLNFKALLSGFLGAASPSFSQISGTLKDMERVVSNALQNREPHAEEAPAMPVSDQDHPSDRPSPPSAQAPVSGQIHTRSDAYRQLEAVATFLEKNDPHSPAHQLLRQLIRWENKNILDIFGDISQSPQDLGVLMKLLGNPPTKGG